VKIQAHRHGGNMNFVDYLTTLENVSLNGITPWLQQLYISDHNWKNGEQTFKVAEMKREYVVNNVLLYGISSKLIEGKRVNVPVTDVYGMPCCDDMGAEVTELSYDLSYVNVVSMIKYVTDDIKDKYLIPEKLLVHAGIEVQKKNDTGGQSGLDADTKRELAVLKNEKLKWDASIAAAVQIGLLFWEGELSKPTTKEAFISEFNEKVGGLPDTTVEMIYKALPTEYRNRGGKPKKISTEIVGTGTDELNTAIKAAVYAGSLFDTNDVKSTKGLTGILEKNKYQIPSETVLQKIVEAAMDV
jgi:hypothetical protein